MPLLICLLICLKCNKNIRYKVAVKFFKFNFDLHWCCQPMVFSLWKKKRKDMGENEMGEITDLLNYTANHRALVTDSTFSIS